MMLLLMVADGDDDRMYDYNGDNVVDDKQWLSINQSIIYCN